MSRKNMDIEKVTVSLFLFSIALYRRKQYNLKSTVDN